MIRELVTLSEDDTAWLDRTATHRGVSMTEIVRTVSHSASRTWRVRPSETRRGTLLFERLQARGAHS